MTQEVTELRPPMSWAVHGVDGPIRPSARVTVAPLDGGHQRAAPVSYRNLKQRLEHGT